MGSNFEALGAPCLFLGVLWVAGLPRGAQNELIELPVWAGAHLRQQLAGSGLAGWPEGLGRLASLWQPVAACCGPLKEDKLKPRSLDFSCLAASMP